MPSGSAWVRRLPCAKAHCRKLTTHDDRVCADCRAELSRAAEAAFAADEHWRDQ